MERAGPAPQAAAWRALSTGAPVLAWTSSRVTPGASSISVKARPILRCSSNTPSSVITHVDHAGAGQRQVAALQQLVLVALGGVLHHHDHALDAGHQVHGPAHALDHLAGDHPVGEVAVHRHLHRPQDRQVDVAAADHARSCRPRRNSWSAAAR